MCRETIVVHWNTLLISENTRHTSITDITSSRYHQPPFRYSQRMILRRWMSRNGCRTSLWVSDNCKLVKVRRYVRSSMVQSLPFRWASSVKAMWTSITSSIFCHLLSFGCAILNLFHVHHVIYKFTMIESEAYQPIFRPCEGLDRLQELNLWPIPTARRYLPQLYDLSSTPLIALH